MAEIVIMPKLGFNMDEGKLVSWYKAEGDNIKKGEPLFAIETDKTVIDIEATLDGVVRKLFVEEGELLPVTLPVAIIGSADEEIGALLSEAASMGGSSTEAPAETPEPPHAAAFTPSSSVQDSGKKVTPRARRFASESGIDLGTVDIAGTGYQGGICESDLVSYLETAGKLRATPLAKKVAADQGTDISTLSGSGPGGKVLRRDLAGVRAESGRSEAAAEQTSDGKVLLESVPYAGIRKVIGDRLSESKFTAPHLYFTQKVNMEKVLELRREINDEQDVKTSVTDYIARAAVIALAKFPDINASLVNGAIEKYITVNLGLAVAAPSGLIVPNIKDAETMSVVGLAAEAKKLIEKAREGKLSPAEYSGGTFTISNLGMFGIENFTAIINPPESAILAVSSTKDEPWVVVKDNGEKTLEIKPVMNINLTVDHRIIDGLLAAQFVTEIRNLLEHPIKLLI